MRKVIFAAMIVAALTVFAGGTSSAWADCGSCKEKCGCSQKADCGCKDKCGCEKQSCGCKKESKCGCEKPKCGCQKDKCGCEKPKCGKCASKCGCGMQVAKNHHPYECMFRGSSMLCDKGCCSGPVCIPKCEVCTTTCKKVECKDECGCSHVSWESHTTCGAPVRPRTIPWWFNIEAGTGNIYPTGDEGADDMASAEEADDKETEESSEA